MVESQPVSVAEKIDQNASEEYFNRVASGKVFGEGTADLLDLPDQSSALYTREKVFEYFEHIRKGTLVTLEQYGLTKEYSPEEQAALLDKVQNICYVYGIENQLFSPESSDQIKLMIMGVAVELVQLDAARQSVGKVSRNSELTLEQQEIFVERKKHSQERKQLFSILRMITRNGRNKSTKVADWYRKNSEKAAAHPEQNAYAQRAHFEAQFLPVADSVADQIWRERAENAQQYKDEELSQRLTAELPNKPEIKRLLELANLSEHTVNIIVTRLSPSEFRDVFKADGMMMYPNTLILCNDLQSTFSWKNIVHEYAHTLQRSTESIVGNAVVESDTEAFTRLPTSYSQDRYYVNIVDEIISRLGTTQSGKYSRDIRMEHNLVIGARVRGEQIPANADAEKEWNQTLLNNFGLSGYVYFYAPLDQYSSMPEVVKQTLPTKAEALAKLLLNFKHQDQLLAAFPEYNPSTLEEKPAEAIDVAGQIVDNLWKPKLGSFIESDTWDTRLPDPNACTAEELRRYLEILDSYYGTHPNDDTKRAHKLIILREMYSLKRGFPATEEVHYLSTNQSDPLKGYLSFYDEDFINPDETARTAINDHLQETTAIVDVPYPEGILVPAPIHSLEVKTLQNAVYVRFFGNSLQCLPGESKAAVYKSLVATCSTVLRNTKNYTVASARLYLGSKYVQRLVVEEERLADFERNTIEFNQELAQLLLTRHHEWLAEGITDLDILYENMYKFIDQIDTALDKLSNKKKNILHVENGVVRLETQPIQTTAPNMTSSNKQSAGTAASGGSFWDPIMKLLHRGK